MLATQAPLATIRSQLMATAARASNAVELPSKKAPARYKLDDPEVVKALGEKYAHLAAPGPLYTKVAEAYALVGKIMAAPSFVEASGSSPSFAMRAQGDTSQTMARAMNAMKLSKSIKDAGADGVMATVNLPTLVCRVPGAMNSPTPAQKEAHAGSLAVMRALFPQFMSVYGLPVAPSTQEVKFEVDTRVLPIEALAVIKVPDVPPLDLKSWDEGYRGMVKLALTVRNVRAYQADERVTEFDTLDIEVAIDAQIMFPADYARWATGTIADDEWAPALFWSHASRVCSWHMNPDSKGKAPAPRSTHPMDLERITKKLADTFLLAKRPMVNSEGITMTPDGNLMWVPDTGNFTKYVETIKNTVDAEGNVAVDGLASQHVGTDWTAEKLYLTDEAGIMHLVDLSGARPLDDVTIGHVLNGHVDDMLGRLFQMCGKAGIAIDTRSMDQLDERIPLLWENLIDVPYYPDENDARNARLFALGRAFSELYTKMTSTASFTPYEQLSTRPYAALFGAYGQRRAELAMALIEHRAANAAAASETEPPELNNLPGVDGVMPHQIKLFNKLKTNPFGAILDVSAGGGKSLAYMTDVTDLMSKGLVKRPVIVMPRNLIAQFAVELLKFSKGYVKPFAINARVWRTWMRRIGSNPKAARGVLESMPKNTVFLVDYGWLGQNAVTYAVNDDEGKVYPNASMLASMGFDYVCLDESQRAKKLTSNRTRAANVVAAVAKYRRIGSGTILHNTARDLLGQMSIINPMALGAMGAQLKESDRVSIDRLPALRKQIETFARRLKVPRREWAHLLPTLHERVHTVRMTRNQNEFYDKIMKDLAAEVANDPKVRKLMKQNSEQAEEQLAKVFKRYLAKVEIWLNAPDSTFNEKQYGHLFKAVPGLSREDLMSPKVAAIDQLVEAHFRGGRGDVDGQLEDLPPDPFKIMIVGYNKPVSDHIIEHMHHKGLALQYKAGDDAVLDRFKTDDSIKILVADETAMQEGHNLQMVSRIIRLQTLWTPGGQEQLLARMMRPDVPNKEGVIKYARDRVWLDWIVVEPSIEIAKMARLIGKLVENSVVQEADTNPNLARVLEANKSVFGRIKRIKMNLDMLRDRNLQTVDMLQDQFSAYQIFKNWENSEFQVEKKRLTAEVQAKIGRKLKPGELGPLSMTPVPVKTDEAFAPGNRLYAQGYTPWIEGFSGFNPTSLHLVPITLPPEEDDEDEDVEADDDVIEEENVHVEVGDVVATEFGLGYITRARRNASIVEVNIPGFRKEAVKLKRYNVLGPTNDADKETLRRLLQQAKQVNVLTMDTNTGDMATKNGAVDDQAIKAASKTSKSLKPAAQPSSVKPLPTGNKLAPIPPKLDVKPLKLKAPKGLQTLDMRNVDTDKMIDAREFTTTIFNGVIALVTEEKDEDADAKLARAGFDRFGRTVQIRVKTARAFDALVEALAEKYYIPRAHKRVLDEFAAMYTKHKENVAYLKARAYTFHALWVRDQKKKATEKNELRPFPVVEHGHVYLYINAESCPAALKLKTFTPPAGVMRPVLLESGWMAFAATRREAVTIMDKFEAKKGKVTNRASVIGELKTIK